MKQLKCPECGESIPMTEEDRNFCEVECPWCGSTIDYNYDEETSDV